MSSFNPFRSASEIVLSDGGLETSLAYKAGMPLREEAAFEAFYTPKYATFMKDHMTTYCRQAIEAGHSVTLDTPTYRASSAYFDKMGIASDKRDDPVSRESVTFLKKIRDEVSDSASESDGPVAHFLGAIGPMGDAYNTTAAPTVSEAREYHRKQVRALTAAGVTAISCYTFTNSNEAIGVALEAGEANIPCAVSFTLERSGLLTCGETIGEAISAVDAALPGPRVCYFGINCIHPSALRPILKDAIAKGEQWVPRLKMFRGNASAKSHEELENSTELDEGDPVEWAQAMADLQREFSTIQLCGGCCGTGPEHQLELARAFGQASAPRVS